MNWLDYLKEKKNIEDIYKKYRTPDGTYLLSNQNNDLSHIFGSYYLSRKYPREEVVKAQKAKENWDKFAHNVLHPINIIKRAEKKADTARDLVNNRFGLDLYSKNPNMTDKEVMDWVYNNYLKQMRNIYDEQQKAEKNVSAIIQDDDFGQYGQGNIDLYSRPQVKNPDGSVSTVRSMSFNDGEMKF